MFNNIKTLLANTNTADATALEKALDDFKFTSDTGIAHFLSMDLGGGFAAKGYQAVGKVAGIVALNTSIFAGIIYG